jgi:hypothetical protein
VEDYKLLPVGAGIGWSMFEQGEPRSRGPWHKIRVFEIYRRKSGHFKAYQRVLAWHAGERRFAQRPALTSFQESSPRIYAEVEAVLRRVRWPNVPLVTAAYSDGGLSQGEAIESSRVDPYRFMVPGDLSGRKTPQNFQP